MAPAPAANISGATKLRQPGSGTTTKAACPTKLFIGGITRNTTTKQLREHFERFGRVLDCVAMRLPDGRPRGFGYVTLDSPKAAESCLSEPQTIDGRIVDLKRAVPESDMGSPPIQAAESSSAAMTSSLFGSLAPQHPLGDIWCDWQCLLANGSAYDGLSMAPPGHMFPPATFLPQALASPQNMYAPGLETPDCVDLLSTLQFPQQTQHPGSLAGAGLSGDAPEFFPTVVDHGRSSVGRKREKKAEAQRVALGEITNVVRSEGKTKPTRTSMKASLPNSENQSQPMPQRRNKLALQVTTDDIFQEISNHSSLKQRDVPLLISPPGLDGAGVSHMTGSEPSGDLSSLGSVHLPRSHAVKPGAQKRQERKVERLQNNAATKVFNDMHQNMAYSMAGVGALQSLALSTPLSFGGKIMPAIQQVAPPPGLEGLSVHSSYASTSWQPDAELSPAGSTPYCAPR